MTVDYLQILIGAGITAVLSVGAFFGRRIITKEGARENVALFNDYASIAVTLRDKGITIEEIENIAGMLKARKQIRKLRSAEVNVNSLDVDETASPYWAQSAMNARAGASDAVADAELNAAIAELHGLLSDEEDEAFAAAHSAWAAYRDKQAEFIASQYAGGSMAQLVLSSERESLSRQRIAVIRALAEQIREQ